MSPEIQITREMVKQVRSEIKAKTGGRFWPGELEWITLEVMVDRLRLPWKDEEGFQSPDFSDPRVKELHRQLNEFGNVDAPIQIKKLKVPWPGGVFTEVPYTESLPDPDTLAAVADSNMGGISYMFAALVEREGKRDVIFTPGPSHDKIQEALTRENQEFQTAEWNHAQLGLTQGGKIDSITLRNHWGRDSETQRSNVMTLIGKINPELFYVNPSSGAIRVRVGFAGSTIYKYDPTGNELKEKVGGEYSSDYKSLGSVPALYKNQ